MSISRQKEKRIEFQVGARRRMYRARQIAPGIWWLRFGTIQRVLFIWRYWFAFQRVDDGRTQTFTITWEWGRLVSKEEYDEPT